MNIMNLKGKIYYSDTDSIVTDIKLPDNMVSSTEMGKLKLEHFALFGIFITGKTYTILDQNGKFHNKAKGVKNESLSYIDYVNLLGNKNVTTAIKFSSELDWNKGTVSIKDINVTINSNSYTKRSKLLNFNKQWVNTAFLFINEIDKDLICYENKLFVIPIKSQKLATL